MTDNEKVLVYINQGVETEIVDFKQIFYSNLKNSNMARHVAAFANNNNNEDKFIIFGVSDKPREICGIETESIPDIAHIENFLSEKIEPYISVSINCFKIGEKEVAYLKISKDNLDRPYVIKNDCGVKNIIQRGDVYIRKGTCNLKALRLDLDNMYENNKEKSIRIFSDYISVSPIRMHGKIPENPTYGQLSIEIINHSDKPFLLRDGYITIRNEYGKIERRIYDILPKFMISENPFEVPAKSRFEKTALFEFTSNDCITMRFEDDGNLHYETYAKTIFIDSDNNEYHSDEIKVMIKASGDVLHKIKRLYSELRNYLKKNERQLINTITSHKNDELEKILNKSFVCFSFIQPGYVLGNSEFPEYDIVAKMVRAAIDGNNSDALIMMRNLELRDDFIEFARL